jgi:transglutaminase-like putative cysteine protease
MNINVGCRLRYEIAQSTGFVFQIEAAKADSQIVRSEALTMPVSAASAVYKIYVDPVTMTRKVVAMLGPGPIEVVYQATVEVDSSGVDPARVDEFEFNALPMQFLEYIAPSRYCPSDTFTDFAHSQFGALPRGHERIVAICDWIYSHVRYEAGSTGPNATAADVFQAQRGVCRDFAHLGISLTRALGVPARYASVYADELDPQDFHAVFQAYLNGPNGGEWYAFDATRMASVEAMVRIAAGRDAADVAFAWPQGPVASEPPEVWAEAPSRAGKARTALAVGN